MMGGWCLPPACGSTSAPSRTSIRGIWLISMICSRNVAPAVTLLAVIRMCHANATLRVGDFGCVEQGKRYVLSMPIYMYSDVRWTGVGTGKRVGKRGV
jgi:hypothetical protein